MFNHGVVSLDAANLTEGRANGERYRLLVIEVTIGDVAVFRLVGREKLLLYIGYRECHRLDLIALSFRTDIAAALLTSPCDRRRCTATWTHDACPCREGATNNRRRVHQFSSGPRINNEIRIRHTATLMVSQHEKPDSLISLGPSEQS